MLRDLAATARLPNLPTVWSNVAASYLLALAMAGSALAGSPVAPEFSAVKLACLLLSASLLYLFGTFLNDAIDADFDQLHQPGRPIPAGRLGRGPVLNAGLLCGAAGLALAVPAGRYAVAAAAILAVLVLLYTWIHKQSALGIPLMAFCRGMLPPLATTAVISHWGSEFENTAAWIAAASTCLTCYTAGISLAARTESTTGPGRLAAAIARLLLSLPFLAPAVALLWLFLGMPDATGWTAGAVIGVTGACGLGWVWFASSALPRSPATFVSRALPGLALVDTVILLPIWLPEPAWLALPLGCFFVSLLLQRIAPAT